MNYKFELLEINALKIELDKSDKELERFLNRYNLKRDVDVDELHLPSLSLSEIRSLKRFKNLKILWLQSNKIKTLPFIQSSKYLTEIYLQNNLIQSIKMCLRNLTNLELIHLQANQLSDLNETVEELSYLKFLKNLNLFDNPIELEKQYRWLILYKLPSLVVFDRNTIDRLEKIKSIKHHEPERELINKKHAFLRSVSLKNIYNENDSKLIRKNYASTSLSQYLLLPPLNFSEDQRTKTINDKKSSINNNKYYNEVSDKKMFNTNSKIGPTTIKEFSYFDWSKVKLLQQSTNISIDDNENQMKNNTNNYENNYNFNDKLNKIKFKDSELPQVVTIRFT